MKPLLQWLVAGALVAAAACGPAQPSKAGLHKDCSAPSTSCEYGQRCLQYTGFAGQPLASCEIVCSGPLDCPEPLTCAPPISDGPEQPTCQ